MKVSGKSPSPMQTPDGAKASKASGPDAALETLAKRDATSTTSGADLKSASRVDVSTRAQDIKRAKELATPSDSIDEAKVARLQALIDAGEYKVNADAIADRLLDEHSKMPG